MRRQLVGATAGLAGASAVATVGVTSFFTRKFVRPEPPVDENELLAVGETTVRLRADEQTTAPGRYGLWWDGYAGHLRLGGVLERTDHEVTRELVGVDFGRPRPGPARLNGYYYVGPPADSLGIPLQDVTVDGPVGAMPGWHVPGRDPDRWAILVHGRGALRAECLRAVRPLHELGFTVLIPSYRNDIDAPSSEDGFYHLGVTEWEDVEAALRYAAERGARDIVLCGWSMGGSTVLQVLDRSWLAERVSKVVLNAPVVDWVDVMDFHAHANRLPGPLSRLGRRMLRGAWSHRVLGVHPRLDLARTDWVARADELRVPILLIHSVDDDLVPVRRSRELARRRPDLVTMPAWQSARHCREWNTDPARWDALVREFLVTPRG